jgi:tRNA A-37 threonylcarbamoyl transferase component Bud32
MLEDFAKKEYDVFLAFSNAGIAPRPLGMSGPLVVPGGQLFNIRMERVKLTLHKVLWKREPRGVRQGFTPPSEKITTRIASKMVATLQCMWDNGLVHGDLHLHNIALQDEDVQEPLLLLDFGRSSNNAGKNDPIRAEAFRAGHEYDVFRLVVEMCTSYDELVEEWQTTKKECEKELRELKRTKALKETREDYQLHHNRQIVGLQAYLAEEPKALEQVEQVYTTLITALVKYANTKFGLPYDGVPCVRSRRMRQNYTRQQKAAHAIYFKSDLFWDETSSS